MATTFHPYPNLPQTLQSDILTHALPEDPVLISAFWTLIPDTQSYKFHLPPTKAFRSLQNIATLNDPLLPLGEIKLRYTSPAPHTPESAPIKEEIIYLRPSTDILYLPFLSIRYFSAKLDVTHFLSSPPNQKIKKLAITFADFSNMQRTIYPNKAVPGLRINTLEASSLVAQLILGLKELETLYVIAGDEGMRLFLPKGVEWGVEGRAVGGSVLLQKGGKWTGEEEVELVAWGTGTFPSMGRLGYDMMGTRGEGDGVFYSSGQGTSMEVEESWRKVVEGEKTMEGRGEWKAPKVVAWEVKCLEG
ncbi:hypothetical protein N431DRAFT_111668 [Stipitochalara longipes BDJ]|nr:hypothetical protein N431DRAFT_111668 [Stipitochalara longipes BDJ]